MRDDGLCGVVSRVGSCKNEALEAVNDMLIVENVRSLEEAGQKVVTAHLTLSHSVAAVHDDLEDFGIDPALVLDNVCSNGTEVHLYAEQNLDRTRDRVAHSFHVNGHDLLDLVADSLAEAALAFDIGVCHLVVVEEIKFVVIHV